MTRWKAFAIHLGLSALVLGTIAFVIVWRWYPPSLFHVARADALLLLLGGVDLVLGPLLTLIVYKQGKKSLKFDLSTIALLQFAALAFGLNTVWQSRPVFLVGSDTRLTLLFAHEIDPTKLAKAPAPYRRLPAFGPRTVAVTLADNLNDLIALTGKDPRANPANFTDYSRVAPQLGRNARPVDSVARQLPTAQQAEVEKAIRALDRPRAAIGLVSIQTSRGAASMLVERRTGELLRPLGIAPPPPNPAERTQSAPQRQARDAPRQASVRGS